MPTPKKYLATDGTATYRVRLRLNGRQTSETFDNIAAANAFCSLVDDIGAVEAVQHRAMSDSASSEYVPTFAELLIAHVEELTGVDQRTRDDYLDIARRSLFPLIGPMRIDAIKRPTVSRVVNHLDGRHAPKTVRNIMTVFGAVMSTAVAREHITVNPCRGVRLPRTGEEDVEEIRFLTYAEFDTLLALIPTHYRPFVIFLFGTGLRFSEATALQRQDFDLDAFDVVDGVRLSSPRVRVVRAWKRERGKGMRLGPPKSRMSRRTVWLPPEVVEVVRPLLEDKPGSGWAFTTATGLPIQHSNFFNRIWKPATVAASICAEHMDPACRCATPKPGKCRVHTEKDDFGLRILAEPCGCPGTISPRPRIHDSRHSHASWLIAQGARLEVIQERLGHEDYTTTRKIYGHLMPDMRREAANAASLAFASTSLAQRLQVAPVVRGELN